MNKWIVIFVSLLVLLAAADIHAWGCEYERLLDQTLDVSDSQSLVISAAAGDLKIVGVSGSDEVKINGKVCVSRESWLDEASLETTSGDQAEISVVLPDSSGSWSLWRDLYAYMDLVLEVPDGLALQLQDSSGDMEIEGIHSLSLQDSSGDIDIRNVAGLVEIRDSSGDIEVRGLRGDFTIISDSSGDIRGSDIDGNVRVMADSSGEIWFTEVRKDFVVERDSSGDIVAENIDGDFTVLKDSSGDIRSKNINGETTIPENKR
jgi:DUF4097 and DUF4098 domain-containing protein YvlB